MHWCIGTLVLDANMSEVVDDNVYSTFLRHRTSSGAVFLWCSHNEDKDVFVMNDMDAQSGATLPSALVHVSRHQFGAHVKYSCTCGVFKHVNSDRLSARPEESDSTGVSFQSTCAHCRFLREQVEEYIPSVLHGDVSAAKMLRIVTQTSRGSNQLVIQVGTHSFQTVVKFSVVPQDKGEDPSFVHLSRSEYISCRSGECRAKSTVTRGIKRLVRLHKAQSLCPHLAEVASNQSVLRPFGDKRQPVDGENYDDDDIFSDLVSAFCFYKYSTPDIWWLSHCNMGHRHGSTLALVVACCLTALNYYPELMLTCH